MKFLYHTLDGKWTIQCHPPDTFLTYSKDWWKRSRGHYIIPDDALLEGK